MSLTLFLVSYKLFHLVNGIFGAGSVGLKNQMERRLRILSDLEGFVEVGEITFARFLSVPGIWMVVFGRDAAQVVALEITETLETSQRKIREELPSRNLPSLLGWDSSTLASFPN